MIRKQIYWIIIICVLFTDCSQSSEYFPVSTSEMVIPSLTPTKTEQYTPTVTQTPLLSKDPEVVSTQQFDHIPSQSSCKLPCVWGITPGVTTIENLFSSILNLGSFEQVNLVTPLVKYYYSISIPNEGIIGAIFVSDDEMVTEILVAFRHISFQTNSEWASTLFEFGEPDEILFEYFTTPDPNVAVFQLGLKYDDVGMFILFEGESRTIEDTGIRLCPLSSDFLDNSEIYVITWPKGEYRSIHDFQTTDVEQGPSLQTFAYYTTDLTDDIFNKTYILENRNDCFDVFQPSSP